MATSVGGQTGKEFKTSQATVFKLVRDATAEIPAKRVKMERGSANEVYLVTTHEENRYVVRIQHNGEVPFAQEAWALEQARQVGAPVAKVLHVGEQVIDGLPRGVMVQEYLRGTPLDERLPKLTSEQREDIFRQAGQILAKIHRIPVGGFYRRHAGGSWDFYDWNTLQESALRDRTAESEMLLRAGVSQEDVTMALSLIENYRDTFPCETPVLCHGDFHPAHLLMNDAGDLTGVLDFGDFQGGPPVHDIAYLSTVYPQIPMDALRDGYGAPPWWDDETFPVRLLMQKAELILGYLAYYIEDGSQEEAQAMANALHQTASEARTRGL